MNHPLLLSPYPLLSVETDPHPMMLERDIYPEPVRVFPSATPQPSAAEADPKFTNRALSSNLS